MAKQQHAEAVVPDELVGPSQAARILEVHTETLILWHRKGTLVPIMIAGRRYYKRPEMEKLAKERNQKAAEKAAREQAARAAKRMPPRAVRS